MEFYQVGRDSAGRVHLHYDEFAKQQTNIRNFIK